MPASAPPRKGSSSPGWVRTAKFVAVMATIAVLLGVSTANPLPSGPSAVLGGLKHTHLRWPWRPSCTRCLWWVQSMPQLVIAVSAAGWTLQVWSKPSWALRAETAICWPAQRSDFAPCDLQATDLPGSGSVKRLAAATGLAMYAEDPGVPFPRPEVQRLLSLLLSRAIPQLRAFRDNSSADGSAYEKITSYPGAGLQAHARCAVGASLLVSHCNTTRMISYYHALSHSIGALQMTLLCLFDNKQWSWPLSERALTRLLFAFAQRRSLFAQKSSNLKLPDPIRTNERPKVPLHIHLFLVSPTHLCTVCTVLLCPECASMHCLHKGQAKAASRANTYV